MLAKNDTIYFEFTLPGTPHKNGVIEGVFATIYFWIHAMIVHIGLYDNTKTDLSPEWEATTIKLQNIIVNPHEEKSAHEKLYGKMSDDKKYFKTLYRWDLYAVS